MVDKEFTLFLGSMALQLATSLVLYFVKFKMFSMIKFFFIPIALLFALSMCTVCVKLCKYNAVLVIVDKNF
jgi:hypothetical protein